MRPITGSLGRALIMGLALAGAGCAGEGLLGTGDTFELASAAGGGLGLGEPAGDKTASELAAEAALLARQAEEARRQAAALRAQAAALDQKAGKLEQQALEAQARAKATPAPAPAPAPAKRKPRRDTVGEINPFGDEE